MKLDRAASVLRRLRTQPRLFITAVMITVLPALIIFTILQYLTITVMTDQYNQSYSAHTYQLIENNLENLFARINTFSLNLVSDDAIYDILGNHDMSPDEKQAAAASLLLRHLEQNSTIANIAVVTKDGNMYASFPDSAIKPSNAFLEQIQESFLVFDSAPRYDSEGNRYYLLGKRFQNFNTSYQLGSLVLYIRAQAFETPFEEMTYDGSYYFLCTDGQVMAQSAQLPQELLLVPTISVSDRPVRVQVGNDACLAMAQRIEIASVPAVFQLVNIMTDDAASALSKNLMWYINIAFVVIMLLSLMLSMLLSNRLIASLKSLCNKINRFGTNMESYQPYVVPPRDEIAELENSFNEMAIHINELMEQNAQEQEKQKIAELRALQAQINPHFIYNTLDVISWIAKLKGQQEILKITHALASFFRISLHKGETIIKVQEEIDHVNSYVTIEQMRSPGKFEVSYEIEEGMLQYDMLKIILQPIVENAIKHGINERDGQGHIRIIGYVDGDFLKFEVIDDGVGFDPSILEDPTFLKNNSAKGGYGLANVQDRIRLEYGNDCGLKFISKPGRGTRVEITLKKRHADR